MITQTRPLPMNLDAIENAVIRTISPAEKMSVGNEEHYFRSGQSALECINVALQAARMDTSDVKRILDLPCGHGRVLRYLKAAFPGAEIGACDMMRDGVDFCASDLGAIPIYSEDDPHKIPIDRDSYDLIWVGSLFTHFDSDLWIEFLDVFRSSLRPGGLLVFTTHGRHVHHKIVGGSWQYTPDYRRRTTLLYDYQRTGFGYVDYTAEQASHHNSGKSYGMSLSTPAWVLAQVFNMGRLRVIHFSERSWHNHQDCFACVRDDSFQAAPAPDVNLYNYMKQRLKLILKRP